MDDRRARPLTTVLFGACLVAGVFVGHFAGADAHPTFGNLTSKGLLMMAIGMLIAFHRLGDKRFYIPKWCAILYFLTGIFLGSHLWP